MVLYLEQINALDRLRSAIVADVREDMEMIDDLSEWHTGLVDAWNAAVRTGVASRAITDADLS